MSRLGDRRLSDLQEAVNVMRGAMLDVIQVGAGWGLGGVGWGEVGGGERCVQGVEVWCFDVENY
jgi:hypothetical protein